MGFSGSKCAGSLSMAIPNATFMGEVQGEKLARSVTQIFSSLKTEALTQDILLHDGSFRRRYLGGECMWKRDLSHRIEVWERVWLFQNHRTIPGNIRRAIESHTCLTQMNASNGLAKTLLHNSLSVHLGCFNLSMWWVGGANTSEEAGLSLG